MTNEERDLITRFIERVGGASTAAPGGSVPASQGASQGGAAGLAPIDPEADTLIGQLMTRYPEARYRITQLAFVQERALEAAQHRIAALQAELQHLQSAAGPQPSPWGQGAQVQSPPQSRGFFGSLFGGGATPAAAPAPQAPAYQPPTQAFAQPQSGAPAGMFQPQGTGFLGGALRTAAGVAGGVLAADALMSLFQGPRGGGLGGLGAGAAMPGGVESGLGTPGGWVDAAPVSDPTGGGGFAPDPYDQGGALKSDPGSDPFAAGQGGGDAGGWTPAADPSGGDTGWQDAPPDNGGGWDTGSGGSDDDGGWVDSSSDA